MGWSDLRDPNGTIKVCVADTGYDLGHEDTPKDNDVTGTDNPEYSNDRWDRDPHGHGTHCSGTVSALGGNDKGVVGVIPNNAGERFQLVIANSLTGSGSGSWSGAAAGNGGNTNKLYPASYPSLMSVAAIDSNKNKA